jgi:hypothetical protein
LFETELLEADTFKMLSSQADELFRMIKSSILTTKSNAGKLKRG